MTWSTVMSASRAPDAVIAINSPARTLTLPAVPITKPLFGELTTCRYDLAALGDELRIRHTQQARTNLNKSHIQV